MYSGDMVFLVDVVGTPVHTVLTLFEVRSPNTLTSQLLT